MLSTLPLDMDNIQLREGDGVVFLSKDKMSEIGIIFKITDCYAWLKCPISGSISKRNFRNVLRISE